ncbi:hypothetical protein [Spirillospora albida]|uniref:hypothetical protein n=1 Tax=Spirillospora albida TaxID=58123 RepID=UPI0004C271D0|nr:hypothetical protein [Spirillospora albida]
MTAVQQAPQTAPPAAPPAARPSRSPARARHAPAAPPPTGIRRALPRTVAARVRVLTALAAALLVALLAVAWTAVTDAREGIRVIGHDAGPQVVATGDLYFQLTDMDAQLANALLGADRRAALARYEQNREKAGAALLASAKLADESTEDNTARDLLDAFGRYERLAGQALLLDEQNPHAAGPPARKVLDVYREATDLMKLDLLPKAYNLTLDNGTLVRHTYEEKRSAVLTGRTLLLVTGLLLLAVLAGLQLYLAARFRRLLNPALALATLGTLVLVTAGTMMLSAQAAHLRDAKQEGFDSILALARARAISNSANADETRFLLDPGRADAYEQVFLSKSQTVLYLPAGNLGKYHRQVEGDLTFEPGRASFLGFLGDEASRSTEPRQVAALRRVLEEYKGFQRSDRAMRDLVYGGQRGRAVGARAGAAEFAQFDRSLQELIGTHRTAFDTAVRKGDDGTGGWYAVLPAAGAGIALLLLLGVRPRLAEYRWSK